MYVHPPTCVYTHPHIYMPTNMYICPPTCMFTHPHVYMPTYITHNYDEASTDKIMEFSQKERE